MMSDQKNAAYFESQLRPHLRTITDPTIRSAVEDLIQYTASTEEKKELEAEVPKPRPRPEGDELKKIVSKLNNSALQKIEASAGRLIRRIVSELINYAQQLAPK